VRESHPCLARESAAINLYLAEKYKNLLFPSTPQGRGRVLQWTCFVANDIEPAMITLFRNRVYFPPEQRSATLADQAEQTLRTKLAILEQQLVESRFLRWRKVGHGRLHGRVRALCSHAPEVGPDGLPKTGCLAGCEHQQTCSPSGTQTARDLRSCSPLRCPAQEQFMAIAVVRPCRCSRAGLASAFGTFRACQGRPLMSDFGGIAEV
jgi:hypothetical protein